MHTAAISLNMKKYKWFGNFDRHKQFLPPHTKCGKKWIVVARSSAEVSVSAIVCVTWKSRERWALPLARNNTQNRCHPSPCWCVCRCVFFDRNAPQPKQPANQQYTKTHIHALSFCRSLSFSRSNAYPHRGHAHTHARTQSKNPLEKNIIFSVYIEDPSAIHTYAVLLLLPFKWCVCMVSGGAECGGGSSSNDTHVVHFVYPRCTLPPSVPSLHRNDEIYDGG